jgi:methyltransferase
VTSRVAFTLFVGFIALNRLVEAAVSARHVRGARRRGGIEAGAAHYPTMVGLHAAFLASCVLEVWLLDRPWHPALGVSMLAVVGCAMTLRLWVIAVLGERWTTRVIYVPDDPLVTAGPFRWLRHPNYVAVVAEVAAIPLVHTAWLTALVFSAANTWLLRRRVGIEEDLLRRLAVRPHGEAHE